MKKYIIAFLIVAVVGTSGFFAARKITGSNNNEGTTAASFDSSQQTVYTAASKPKTEPSSGSAESTSTSSSAAETQKTFTAQIESVSGNVFMLKSVTDTSGAPAGREFGISTDRKNIVDQNGKTVRDDDYENFKTATVTYTGGIQETSPLSVNAQKIVLSQREKCNVYFYIDGKIINTLTVEKGAGVDASDMPHAGAYCDDGYHFECWTDESGKEVFSLDSVEDSIVLNARISHD